MFGETKPRRWGILYDARQDSRRRNFTFTHEFGHYLLHRGMIETTTSGGLYCSEADVEQAGGSTAIEKEADTFAATLLMPLHDFRKQLGPKSRADFAVLGRIADRYSVSLTAAILRWLGYTATGRCWSYPTRGMRCGRNRACRPFVPGASFRRKTLCLNCPRLRSQGVALFQHLPFGPWISPRAQV